MDSFARMRQIFSLNCMWVIKWARAVSVLVDSLRYDETFQTVQYATSAQFVESERIAATATCDQIKLMHTDHNGIECIRKCLVSYFHHSPFMLHMYYEMQSNTFVQTHTHTHILNGNFEKLDGRRISNVLENSKSLKITPRCIWKCIK